MEHIFRSYYTKSDFITNYMVNMLDLTPSDTILEPSAGDGVFVDKLLELNTQLI